MPWFRQLVAVLSLQRPRFKPRQFLLRFVVDKVAMGQGIF
jgi:hypothetical protein